MIVKQSLMLFISLLLLSCHQSGKPILELSDTEIRFDNAEYGKDNIITFKIYNRGDAELKVSKVTAGCHCTSPAIDKRTIAANDSASVKVVYRPVSIGPDMQTVTLVTNANPDGDHVVIKAKVKMLNN